jgi:hypothetical protein
MDGKNERKRDKRLANGQTNRRMKGKVDTQTLGRKARKRERERQIY